jgi:hypothetical protein
MRALLFGASLLAAIPASPALAQPFTGASVIALHRAGLGDGPIVAKIHAMPCGYDTSTDALVAMKKAGLSDQIIVAMVERCSPQDPVESEVPQALGGSSHMAPVAPRGGGSTGRGMFATTAARAPGSGKNRQPEGIYLTAAAGGLTMLRPSGQVAQKVVGNGSILFPRMLKLIVSRPAAQMVVETPRPVFMFYFDPSDRRISEFGGVGGSAAQSPNEFSLVHFRQDKGNRQMTVGRVQPYVTVSGIDPKNTLSFGIKEMGEGAFRVDMAQDLPPGEYGFVLIGDAERSKTTIYRVYDFTVKGPDVKALAGAP